MRIHILIIFLCAIVSNHNTTYAQTTLKKEKIYTLNPDEIIEYDENSLGLYQNKLGYLVVTAKSKTSDKVNRIYHIQGKIYGPYDRRLVDKPVFNWNSWGFIDSQNGQGQVMINGDAVGNYGGNEYPLGLKMAGRSWAHLLVDMVEGSSTVIYNGSRYGPYSDLQDYYLSNDGSRLAIVYYKKPNECYVQFSNGTEKGPYKKIRHFRFLEGENERWVLTAELKDQPQKFIVSTNFGDVGTFETQRVGHPDDTCGYLYTNGENYLINVIKDQKIYLLANDDLIGPYDEFPRQFNISKMYNRFNYLLGKNSDFYFRGVKGFAVNVKKYFVSESRRSVAIVKSAGANRDSLLMNDRDLIGIFDEIQYLKFAPEGEEWAMLSKSGTNFYLSFSNGKKFGPIKADDQKWKPMLLLGKGMGHWGLAYCDLNGRMKLIIDEEEYPEGFVGSIVLIQEDNKEYFSWFSIDGQTIFINKLEL
ncbi:MAG: hypothetical protein EAZ55_04830 [Cytophagales bacterium]|nr:MAG: hypothetical protein EAZ55_04830 [Cytophagales bacterium]